MSDSLKHGIARTHLNYAREPYFLGDAIGIRIKHSGTPLADLPAKVERQIVRRALRDSASVLQLEVKRTAPVLTGDYRRSIKVRRGKETSGSKSVQLEAQVPYAGKLERQYQIIERAAETVEPMMLDSFTESLSRMMTEL